MLSTFRAVALGVVLISATALTACAGTNAGQTSSPSSGASINIIGGGKVTPHNMDKFAFILNAMDTLSFPAATAAGAKAAAKDLGVNVDLYWSAFDPAKEMANYTSIMSGGEYGGIIFHAAGNQMCKKLSSDVAKAQVLVVEFNTPLCSNGSDSGEVLASDGSIAFVSGFNMSDSVLEMMNAAAAKLGDGPQQLLLVQGNQGHGNVVAMDTAWATFSATHPNWKLAGEVYTDWSTPTAFTVTQDALQANPNVSVIFSPYVDITAGAAKAVAAQGLSSKISVFETSGGSKVSVDLIKSGAVQGSFPTYPYDMGYAAVQALVDAGKGVQPPKFITSGKTPQLLTKENISAFTAQY